MEIQITLIQGKKITLEVKDANMTAFLARLNGTDKWIVADADGRTVINPDSIVSIREIKQPPG